MPLKKKSPVSTTTPAAGARTTWPAGALMSRPEWGDRGSPLKIRRMPNEAVRAPGVGRRNFSVGSNPSGQAAQAGLARAPSRAMRASSSGEGFTRRSSLRVTRCSG